MQKPVEILYSIFIKFLGKLNERERESITEKYENRPLSNKPSLKTLPLQYGSVARAARLLY